jgi:hypothetical protein
MTTGRGGPAPPETCAECGASILTDGECLDHFHALLALEQGLPPAVTSGGRGEIFHFYAVTSYVLQHPDTMRYTTAALAGARQALADHLAGRVTLQALRVRVRSAAEGAARITRRPGESAHQWTVSRWPMTVADVLAGGTTEYGERVVRWAESVIRSLDAAEPRE